MIESVENLEHKLKHGYEKYIYSWEKKALVYLFFTFSCFLFFLFFFFFWLFQLVTGCGCFLHFTKSGLKYIWSWENKGFDNNKKRYINQNKLKVERKCSRQTADEPKECLFMIKLLEEVATIHNYLLKRVYIRSRKENRCSKKNANPWPHLCGLQKHQAIYA